MRQYVLFYCVTPDVLIGWHGAIIMYFLVNSQSAYQYPWGLWEMV